MKYDRQTIMKRAWQIKKEDSRNIWSLCLKMAWEEAKAAGSKKSIEELEELGFKRWTKGNFDRMYVNAKELGLVCWYYNTGNIKAATFQGDEISNCEARRMKASKTFIDLTTGKVHSDNRWLLYAACEISGYEAA